MVNHRMDKYRQQGAALVEMALSLLVFLIILLGIIDFTLLLYQMGKGLDVTRHIARQMIVSEPLTTDFSMLSSCDSTDDIGNTTGPIICDGSCDDYAESMLSRYVVGDITVTYSCAITGRPDRGLLTDELIIPELTVNTTVKYHFLFAAIIFGDQDRWLLNRTFTVSRAGEDLDEVE